MVFRQKHRVQPTWCLLIVAGLSLLSACAFDGPNQDSGQGNTVTGRGNTVTGNNNKVNGLNNTVTGDGNSF